MLAGTVAKRNEQFCSSRANKLLCPILRFSSSRIAVSSTVKRVRHLTLNTCCLRVLLSKDPRPPKRTARSQSTKLFDHHLTIAFRERNRFKARVFAANSTCVACIKSTQPVTNRDEKWRKKWRLQLQGYHKRRDENSKSRDKRRTRGKK